MLIPLARRRPSISGAGATTDVAGEATVRIESWLASGVGPITSAKSAGKTNFERVVADLVPIVRDGDRVLTVCCPAWLHRIVPNLPIQ